MNSWVGAILAICGVILGFTALFIPPQGVVDSSALILVAQIFIFSATLLGVKLPELPKLSNTKEEDKTK